MKLKSPYFNFLQTIFKKIFWKIFGEIDPSKSADLVLK